MTNVQCGSLLFSMVVCAYSGCAYSILKKKQKLIKKGRNPTENDITSHPLTLIVLFLYGMESKAIQ